MFGIFLVKCKMLMRNPWSFLILTAAIIGFSFLLGTNYHTKPEIAVYSKLNQEITSPILDELNETSSFVYVLYEEDEAVQRVQENKNELAVELQGNSATIITSASSQNESIVQYEVLSAYQNIDRKEAIISSETSEQGIEEKLDSLADYQVFAIDKVGFQTNESFVYDSSLQTLFGFSLFFVIYTIAFNVVSILTEKKEGVWNRILLSPVKKWELYAGNLLYCFMTGYLQMIVVYCVFRYALDVNFYDAFNTVLLILIPYVFCIIALSLLIAALVKTTQQYNVIIPLVSVCMAMLGGAYWPLEIVTSKVMLLLSKFTPITYAMEALKGATVYGQGWSDLWYPVGMMTAIGLALISIGIVMIDRKN